jgi:hypothetical protein
MTKLSLETATEMYNSGIELIKAFALENYPDLEKKTLPSTWEELRCVSGYYTNSFSNVYFIDNGSTLESTQNTLPTESLAKAMLAMCKLQYLKHIYNDGWVPDYQDEDTKYAICFNRNKPNISCTCNTSRPLVFKSLELVDLFLKNFIDDIIIAKELI